MTVDPISFLIGALFAFAVMFVITELLDYFTEGNDRDER